MLTKHLAGELPTFPSHAQWRWNSLTKSCAFDAFMPCNSNWHPLYIKNKKPTRKTKTNSNKYSTSSLLASKNSKTGRENSQLVLKERKDNYRNFFWKAKIIETWGVFHAVRRTTWKEDSGHLRKITNSPPTLLNMALATGVSFPRMLVTLSPLYLSLYHSYHLIY